MSFKPAELEVPGVNQTLPETGVEPARVSGASAEFFISERPRGNDSVTEVFQRVAERLVVTRADIASVMVYGSLEGRSVIDSAMQTALGPVMWPLTWVEGASCTQSPLAGVQVLALCGRQIQRVHLGRRVVASVFEDEHARHCVLGGLGPNAVSLRRPAQVQQMFGNLECALDLAGFDLSDVVRTWFYNEDILAWYGDFNRVRTAHYSATQFCTRSTPASTAVAGRNPAGAALAVAAWAVKPLHGAEVACEIGSPLQCPAPNYGSSFSRAMEIESGGCRRLFISGTASIEPTSRWKSWEPFCNRAG
jgi:enamine deaminase RidA (YjgF/YER057c/UK114 family)